MLATRAPGEWRRQASSSGSGGRRRVPAQRATASRRTVPSPAYILSLPIAAAPNNALWKHDVEIMWVLFGAVANTLLSQILKKILNHERPAPALRSDPGMPSSHAQSLFFAATVLVLSLFYWLGTNYLTMILGPATLSVATYLSWLRVSQRLHTLNQVVVGAAVGSAFSALWFVLWHSLVKEVLASSPLVRNAIILVSAVFCIGFSIYVICDWLKDE